MHDLAQQLDAAKSHLREVEWSPLRSDAVKSRLHERRRRFTLSTVALGSATIAVAVAVAIVWFAQSGAPSQSSVVSAGQIELRDGTRAVQLGSRSALRLIQEDEDLVSFALDSGKGWFEVTPSATRRVQVVAQDVLVQVLGTEFVVEVTGGFVHVWVQRGKVKVSSEAGTIFLEKGEHQRFRTRDDEPGAVPESVDAGIAEVLMDEDFEEPEEVEDEDLASERTRIHIHDAGPTEAPKSQSEPALSPVDALWKRADAARRSGRFDDAAVALTELIYDHKKDPRAALAAFSLGRVLNDGGRSPEVAARAFAKARKLSPHGPLVEDALLREIEAWHDANDTRRVQSRTKKYLRLFPHGRYRKQILQMGEEP